MNETISRSNHRKTKNFRQPPVADVTIDQAEQVDGDFTPPQIIGFIPKEQLDRAEAASLLSNAAVQGGEKVGFEGRPARGEQALEQSEQVQPEEERNQRKPLQNTTGSMLLRHQIQCLSQ